MGPCAYLAKGKEGLVDGASLLEHAIAGLCVLHPLAACLLPKHATFCCSMGRLTWAVGWSFPGAFEGPAAPED